MLIRSEINFIFFLIAIIFLYGFSPRNEAIKEIETSILQKQYSEAKKKTQKFISGVSDKKQLEGARYYLGLIYIQLGEYDQARIIFRKLIKKTNAISLQDKIYLGLFDAFYLEKKYKRAHSAISRLLKLRPNSNILSLIYLKLAKVNLKLAAWDEAQKYLKKIELDFPESLEAPLAKQLLEEKQYFAVQVGSYLDYSRAEKLMAELKKKGEYVYIVETYASAKKKFYRVRVGKLASLNDAQALKLQLSKEGYPTLIYP